MFRDKEEFKTVYAEKIQNLIGKSIEEALVYDKYITLAGIVRDFINKNMAQSSNCYGNIIIIGQTEKHFCIRTA